MTRCMKPWPLVGILILTLVGTARVGLAVDVEEEVRTLSDLMDAGDEKRAIVLSAIEAAVGSKDRDKISVKGAKEIEKLKELLKLERITDPTIGEIEERERLRTECGRAVKSSLLHYAEGDDSDPNRKAAREMARSLVVANNGSQSADYVRAAAKFGISPAARQRLESASRRRNSQQLQQDTAALLNLNLLQSGLPKVEKTLVHEILENGGYSPELIQKLNVALWPKAKETREQREQSFKDLLGELYVETRPPEPKESAGAGDPTGVGANTVPRGAITPETQRQLGLDTHLVDAVNKTVPDRGSRFGDALQQLAKAEKDAPDKEMIIADVLGLLGAGDPPALAQAAAAANLKGDNPELKARVIAGFRRAIDALMTGFRKELVRLMESPDTSSAEVAALKDAMKNGENPKRLSRLKLFNSLIDAQRAKLGPVEGTPEAARIMHTIAALSQEANALVVELMNQPGKSPEATANLMRLIMKGAEELFDMKALKNIFLEKIDEEEGEKKMSESEKEKAWEDFLCCLRGGCDTGLGRRDGDPHAL